MAELFDTTRRIVARRRGIGNLAMDAQIRWIFVSRDTHVERVASHRSEQRMTEIYRKKLFRLQSLSCSRSWHCGLSSGTRHHKGDTAWEKGIRLGKSQTNPEHFVGTKNGAMGSRTIRRLEPTKLSETLFLLGVQDVPLDLVPNAPSRGRRKKHLTPAPALPPVHENPTDDKSGSSSDSSSSSSSSPQALSGIPQHANVRAQAQTNSRSQQQTAKGGECSCCAYVDCVADGDSECSA